MACVAMQAMQGVVLHGKGVDLQWFDLGLTTSGPSQHGAHAAYGMPGMPKGGGNVGATAPAPQLHILTGLPSHAMGSPMSRGREAGGSARHPLAYEAARGQHMQPQQLTAMQGMGMGSWPSSVLQPGPPLLAPVVAGDRQGLYAHPGAQHHLGMPAGQRSFPMDAAAYMPPPFWPPQQQHQHMAALQAQQHQEYQQQAYHQWQQQEQASAAAAAAVAAHQTQQAAYYGRQDALLAQQQWAQHAQQYQPPQPQHHHHQQQQQHQSQQQQQQDVAQQAAAIQQAVLAVTPDPGAACPTTPGGCDASPGGGPNAAPLSLMFRTQSAPAIPPDTLLAAAAAATTTPVANINVGRQLSVATHTLRSPGSAAAVPRALAAELGLPPRPLPSPSGAAGSGPGSGGVGGEDMPCGASSALDTAQKLLRSMSAAAAKAAAAVGAGSAFGEYSADTLAGVDDTMGLDASVAEAAAAQGGPAAGAASTAGATLPPGVSPFSQALVQHCFSPGGQQQRAQAAAAAADAAAATAAAKEAAFAVGALSLGGDEGGAFGGRLAHEASDSLLISTQVTHDEEGAGQEGPCNVEDAIQALAASVAAAAAAAHADCGAGGAHAARAASLLSSMLPGMAGASPASGAAGLARNSSVGVDARWYGAQAASPGAAPAQHLPITSAFQMPSMFATAGSSGDASLPPLPAVGGSAVQEAGGDGQAD